jgi:CheY-like chemotaxis protein
VKNAPADVNHTFPGLKPIFFIRKAARPACIREAKGPELIKTVLLVDSDPGYTEATKSSLESIKLKVLTVDPAAVREQALALATPDVELAIVSGRMPGLFGPDLVRGMRGQSYTGLIAANSSLPEIQIKLLSAGADFALPDRSSFWNIFVSDFKTLPQHKRPHVGEGPPRPFKCFLYTAMRMASAAGKPLRQEIILPELLAEIEKKTLVPFFEEKEIDNLVGTEILEKFSRGQYADWRKLATIADWNNLINTYFSVVVNNLAAAKVTLQSRLDKDTIFAFQMGHRRLKLIEDWTYYHKDIQAAIRKAVSAYTRRQT